MKPYLVGIAGPSCAGKSYLSAHLARHLGAAILNLDSYYSDLQHIGLEQRAQINFDHPEALDSGLLIDHVRQLSRGDAIEKPVYDFKIHARTGETERLAPREFMIVEGLFALYWEDIRALQQTKVFVDLGEDICLARRVERDMRERGRTRESVLEQFSTTVQPMAQRYVHPTRQFADVVLTGDGEIGEGVERVLMHIRKKRMR